MAVDGVSAISGRLELDTSRETGSVASSSTSGTSFAESLGKVVTDAIGTVKAGEAASIQGLQGNMAPFKVVEAVMDAQRTLQQTLAIRDKVVSAYQEVARMTI